MRLVINASFEQNTGSKIAIYNDSHILIKFFSENTKPEEGLVINEEILIVYNDLDLKPLYALMPKPIYDFLNLEQTEPINLLAEIKAKAANIKYPVNNIINTNTVNSFNYSLGVHPIYLKYKLFDLDFGPLDQIIRHLRISKLLKELPTNKNLHILDIGCGRQAYLGWQYKGPYTGLDRDIPEVQILNVSLKQGTAEEMINILEPEGYDIIVAAAVIEHIEDPKKFMQDCYKLLKPKGKLIFTTPTPKSRIILETLGKLNFISNEEIEEHKQYFTPSLLAQNLFDKGYNIIKKTPFLFGLNCIVVAEKQATIAS